MRFCISPKYIKTKVPWTIESYEEGLLEISLWCTHYKERLYNRKLRKDKDIADLNENDWMLYTEVAKYGQESECLHLIMNQKIKYKYKSKD